MNLKRILPARIAAAMLAFLVLFLASITAKSQIIYTPYVVDENAHAEVDSGAPDGFKVVYISHFGRHGSRYLLSRWNSMCYDLLNKYADKARLSLDGLALQRDVNFVHTLHDGKAGSLSPRGGREHRGIGRRMAERFPELFASGRPVNARSSHIGRCKNSMSNFISSLKAAYPNLKVSASSNIFLYRLFSRTPKVSGSQKKQWEQERENYISANLPSEEFAKKMFINSEQLKPAEVRELLRGLYQYAAISGCLDLDKKIIGKYLTEKQYEVLTEDLHLRYLRKLFPHSLKSAQPASGLLEDFIEKADDVLRGKKNYAADLRFGHDSGFVPLCSIMGLDGFEPWFSTPKRVEDAVPMGANVQVIFYKNAAGQVIVKILHNEKEILIPILDHVIQNVDRDKKILSITAPEGLIDMYLQ